MARQPLPVIVSLGGINGAGRASGHHALARMGYDALDQGQKQRTLQSLASMMGLPSARDQEQYILDHTLIRRVEGNHFDVDAVLWNQRFPTESNGHPVNFDIERKHLPDDIPPSWKVTSTSVTHVNVNIQGHQEFLLPTNRQFEVKAAGQLPTGYEPGSLYPSRSHPRGLEMTVCAASDALGNLGLDWDMIQRRVPADKVSVYAGSAMGQLDSAGAGGMLKARYNGKRVTSKYCPLSLAEMPSDFINAYVLGAMGSTGATLGACASFLYNLKNGIADIRSGRARVAFIGAAEAPINAEVMEGYAAMGALATEKELRQLDGLGDNEAVDQRRACRPFAENCGFTIAESAQMVVLFDDALAMELGATIYGAATDVFVNADGYKKSISGPGVGNYITMAKSVASVRAILGEDAMRRGGLVQAHGTGTPQNRVTESEILSRTAEAFGIEGWPVAALKSYLGHSLGAASGDQVTATLGMWHHGLIPGINTIDALADDVRTDHLAFSAEHRRFDPKDAQYAVINSKGFGGNNATATMLSPAATQQMLKQRYSDRDWQAWQLANEQVAQMQRDYDAGMSAGTVEPVYRFDHGVLHDKDVELDAKEVRLGNYAVSLELENPFADE
ncbi:beta-ketoacyl synthase [Halieaceae bacterium IMCC8485]|uniref:Beta-ketoacyl synthase n=1 Tax=Candidatus Seongchinamella marina TaxID=2518990 RepID=A0ABT3SSY3_9GAMM|nr:beta-ketoacyl synthase [Candidatus Seongchinamella marina]MCX2973104.1 beta-ketoacyl synthase [Candidatus Seongchinamella marina]